MSEQRLKIYLAGKITKDNDWRGDILGPCRPGASDEWDWKWQPRERAIFGEHDYTGPFFLSCDHGCAHGPTSHGVGAGGVDLCSTEPAKREEVIARCMVAIQESDLLFAYLTSADAYGTLVEMGYARGHGVDVAVAWPPSFDIHEMWFARDIATYVAGPFVDPAIGLRLAIGTTLRRRSLRRG